MNFKAYSVLLFFFLMVSSSAVFAQPAQGNVVVMNNQELRLSDTGSISEFDSLTAEYNKWCMDNNEYVLSYKVVRHWWGHNNRDFVTIVEVKGWDEVIKFNQKADELFRAHWDTPAKRKAFNEAYNKYFTGSHSDEIYREVVFKK